MIIYVMQKMILILASILFCSIIFQKAFHKELTAKQLQEIQHAVN